MKYIRTKDGQIVDIGHLPLYKNDEPYTGEGIGIWEGRVPIIREADSIEELCDKFVLVDKNEYERFVEQEFVESKYRIMVEFNLRIYTGSDRAKMNIYGAIWTDKGLIYVAKMNDKKEFELL